MHNEGRKQEYTMSAITRQIALQASYEMGRYAAARGRSFTDCPLTDAGCIRRWHDGYCDFRKVA